MIQLLTGHARLNNAVKIFFVYLNYFIHVPRSVNCDATVYGINAAVEATAGTERYDWNAMLIAQSE